MSRQFYPPLRPVDGLPLVVTSPYGDRINPVTKTAKFHNGVDFRAATGTAIYPIDTGYVERAGYDEVNGWHVIITHGARVGGNAYRSAYCHMQEEPPVSMGEFANTHRVIGQAGSTGRSTAPHLHFMLWENGATVDPLAVLDFAPYGWRYK